MRNAKTRSVSPMVGRRVRYVIAMAARPVNVAPWGYRRVPGWEVELDYPPPFARRELRHHLHHVYVRFVVRAVVVAVMPVTMESAVVGGGVLDGTGAGSAAWATGVLGPVQRAKTKKASSVKCSYFC